MNTQPCIHNMTFTVSLRLKVPVELSREVSKLSRFFPIYRNGPFPASDEKKICLINSLRITMSM